MADPALDPDAKTLLDAILQDLPFFVRGQARTATVEEAVKQARAAGSPSVTREGVVRAMVAITPTHMKAQLKALLAKKGVDTTSYFK